MNKNLIFLIPIVCFSITGYSLYNMNELGIEIIEDRLHTPVNNPILPDHINKDLTCHKVGLYTDWDDDYISEFFEVLIDKDIGGHARQMFFEYDCSLVCYKYWQSDKMCLAELYPHE